MNIHHGAFDAVLTSAGKAARPVLTGMLVGTAVGAAAVLLNEQHTSEETRATEVKLLGRSIEIVNDTASQARSKVQELDGNVHMPGNYLG